jgi:uncharacterized protein (DUF433 family)
MRRDLLNPTTARFDRVTIEPGKMGGRACIRGMRITVSLVLSFVAAGETIEEIRADYPDLNEDDFRQALAYAASRVAAADPAPLFERRRQRVARPSPAAAANS